MIDGTGQRILLQKLLQRWGLGLQRTVLNTVGQDSKLVSGLSDRSFWGNAAQLVTFLGGEALLVSFNGNEQLKSVSKTVPGGIPGTAFVLRFTIKVGDGEWPE